MPLRSLKRFRESLQMIIDSSKCDISENFVTDIVIVGGGISGLFLATLLEKTQKKIIIIEKGNDSLNQNFEGRTVNVGQKHHGSQNENGLAIGGNGRLWGGQFVQFERQDINKNYWGLDYKELQKHYDEIYKIFKIQTTDDPIFHNNNQFIKNQSIDRYFTYFLQQPNIYKIYKDQISNSRNIKLFKNLTANSINFKEEVAQEIYCLAKNKKSIKIKSKIFVFCMGTIENNRFFLSLKQSNNESPIKYNKLIGHYFQDHIGLTAGEVKLYSEKRFRLFFEGGFYKNRIYQPKLKNKKTNVSMSCEFSSKSKYSNTLPELRESIKKFPNFNTLSRLPFLLIKTLNLPKKAIELYLHHKLQKRIKSFFDDGIQLYIQSEQIPEYQSTLTANKNLLSDGLRQISLNWKINGDEFTEIRKFINDVNNFLKSNNIGEIISKELIYSNEKIYANLTDTNHPSGGLIISKNDNEGVCDMNQKVWNTKNIFIGGASAFPNSSYANITATILALTHRLSTYLKKIP